MANSRAVLRFSGAFVAAQALAGMVIAEEGAPLSAIDWLSDSISVPVETPNPDVEAPLASLPSDVTVMSLDAPVPDTAGLREAADLGLESGLWGRSAAADLARSLAELPDGSEAPPSVTRFLHDLLTARFEPPIDSAIDDSFFLARVDRLLTMGQLASAEGLIKAAGETEAQRFRRLFDIALLTGVETAACRTVENTPDLSPTYPTRIFCLARLGQWDVAALTLGNAEALGILTPEEDALLLHFLDPELFEGEPVPEPPRVPSPLLFRLFEAVGERIPTDQLPVAYAYADLGGSQGWKARLRATERLVAAGALGFDELIAVFSERKPAASGGVWERVAAIQAVVPAVQSERDAAINSRLSAAWIAAKEVGYGLPFAEWAVPQLGEVELTGPARHLAFEMALMAGDLEIARAFADNTPEDRFLLALASGQGGSVPGSGLLNQAVVRGLAAIEAGASYEALLADDRGGEALFRALGHLKRGAGGNPRATQNALALLRKLGLETLARQIAVELVLMDGAA